MLLLAAVSGGAAFFWQNWQPLVEADESCSGGCNAHGLCRDGKCHCHAGWLGESCETSACAFQCHA